MCMKKQANIKRRTKMVGMVLLTILLNTACSTDRHEGPLYIRDFHSPDIPIITTVDSVERLLGSCEEIGKNWYWRLNEDGAGDEKLEFETFSYWEKGLQYLVKGDSVQLGRVNFRYPKVEYVLYYKGKRIDDETTISEMKEFLSIENPISDFRFAVITMNGEFYDEGYTMLYSCNNREVPDKVEFNFDENGKLVELNLGCDNTGILSVE